MTSRDCLNPVNDAIRLGFYGYLRASGRYLEVRASLVIDARQPPFSTDFDGLWKDAKPTVRSLL